MAGGRKPDREIRRDHIGRDNRDHAVKSIWIFSQIRVPRSNYRNMTDTTIEPCGWSCYHARTDPLGFPRNLDGNFDQVYDTSIETKKSYGLDHDENSQRRLRTPAQRSVHQAQ